MQLCGQSCRGPLRPGLVLPELVLTPSESLFWLSGPSPCDEFAEAPGNLCPVLCACRLNFYWPGMLFTASSPTEPCGSFEAQLRPHVLRESFLVKLPSVELPFCRSSLALMPSILCVFSFLSFLVFFKGLGPFDMLLL